MGVKMAAPKQLHNLAERFERNIEAYRSGGYNEAQVRREFIDPFFKFLGWDVYNEQGYAEAYKDVIHEESIRMGAATKAPDYCFRIGGTRKFFLEAKKPSIDIKGQPGPAYQLRRYANFEVGKVGKKRKFDGHKIFHCPDCFPELIGKLLA